MTFKDMTLRHCRGPGMYRLTQGGQISAGNMI